LKRDRMPHAIIRYVPLLLWGRWRSHFLIQLYEWETVIVHSVFPWLAPLPVCEIPHAPYHARPIDPFDSLPLPTQPETRGTVVMECASRD
jgi:hypothetical protein